ncbi:MAG TPA: hypothetical protein PKW33_11955 [Anaerolineaceae bacterium]|nr:hypothetical protein [Anaerolineaceae bacterium]HPN52294.1 hypothetical protein [Anaerolineaceae bacterium]
MLKWLSRFPLKWMDLCLTLGLVLFSIILVRIYFSAERYFYYWDLAGYQRVAELQVRAFLAHPRWTLTAILASTNQEYNHFFILPLIPLMTALGINRLGYLQAVALAYQIPAALAAGLVAGAFHPARRTFWTAAFLYILLPLSWGSVLRGYPDVGGMALLLLALAACLADHRFQRWWQPPTVGLLLALAMIFRRHFVYDALALLVALSLWQVGGLAGAIRRKQAPAFKSFLKSAAFIGLAALACLLFLFIIARPFLNALLQTNYAALYSSYALPYETVAIFFFNHYGWLTWAAAASGLIWGFAVSGLQRSRLGLAALMGALSMVLWIILARQISVHYALHALVIIFCGLSALLCQILELRRPAVKTAAAAALGLFLAANGTVSLAGISPPDLIQNFFSARYAPFYRSDYAEVAQIIADLRAAADPLDLIYVADSSARMNYDILRLGEMSLYSDPFLSFVITPQIDSRDTYPLEALAQSTYLIFSSPAQTHLSNPDGQKVVRVISDAFAEKWAFTALYQADPKIYHLENNTTLYLYRRQSPLPLETAVQTYIQMRAYIGAKPGSQKPWILIAPDLLQTTIQMEGQTARMEMNGRSGLSFIHVDPLTAAVKISGSLSSSAAACSPVTLTARLHGPDGAAVSETHVEALPGPQGQPFELSLAQAEIDQVLSLSVNDTAGCPFTLQWQLEP